MLQNLFREKLYQLLLENYSSVERQQDNNQIETMASQNSDKNSNVTSCINASNILEWCCIQFHVIYFQHSASLPDLLDKEDNSVLHCFIFKFRCKIHKIKIRGIFIFTRF